ncbi:T9SS type A sorting domain-containing protein [Rufibacter roseus]|uniref:T9SS type A sorting domain-containing protein n=1 Tax=Rufibacter roseus TaxID=1567108 RepID=A0ABW2DMH1_9BACT|nr:T9SS type A sorting domain-containing protein [Rufibacter roseus]
MMKPLQTLKLLLVTGLGLVSLEASAQTFYEPFTGPGTLAGYNGWITALGTPDETMKQSGSLSYSGLKTSQGDKVVLRSTNSEYLNRLFDTPVTSGTLYGSALVRVLDTDGLLDNGTIGNYFMHFVRAAGSTPYQARVYVRAGSAPNTFNIGILNNTNAGGPTTPVSGTEMFGTSPIDFTIGETYLIVFRHDMTSNSSSIWVNPTLGGTEEPEPMYTATAGAPTTALAGIAFRQLNSAGRGTGNIEVDEIRIGPSFDAVTPTEPLGVKEFAAGTISLYPNPTQGAVQLKLPASLAANNNIDLSVYSMSGEVILNATGSENAMNLQLAEKLNAAAAGVYVVRINCAGQSFQTKMVKTN